MQAILIPCLKCVFSGKFGFNTYNLLTSIVLGFNAVSNLYANINNNGRFISKSHNEKIKESSIF